MFHFEGKVVNDANREILGRIHILGDAKLPGQLVASVISFNLPTKFFIEKHSYAQELTL